MTNEAKSFAFEEGMEKADYKMRMGVKVSLAFVLCSHIPVLICASRLARAIRHVFGVSLMAPLIIFSSLCLLFLAYAMFYEKHALWYRISTWVSGVYLAFMSFFIPWMTIASIICLFPGWKWTGHIKPKIIFATAVACMAVVVYGVIHTKKIIIKKYRVRISDKLKKNYRIIQLSDLHIGGMIGVRTIRKIVNRTNELKPDAVLLSGDIFNQGGLISCHDIKAVARELSRLDTKYGIYGVCGNHDPDLANPDFIRFNNDAKIQMIDNQSCVAGDINIIGRTGLVTYTKVRRPLRNIMVGIDSSKPVVVMDHDPRGIEEAAECRADVMFSGHTHRGQFFPMNVVSHIFNGKGFFYGYNRFGKTISIISAGVGFHHIPIRVGTDSEIVCTDIAM